MLSVKITTPKFKNSNVFLGNMWGFTSGSFNDFVPKTYVKIIDDFLSEISLQIFALQKSH